MVAELEDFRIQVQVQGDPDEEQVIRCDLV
jgi:hypothetical protein